MKYLLFVLGVVGLIGCGIDDDPNRGVDTGMNVILITWDGVRAREFQGEVDPALGSNRQINLFPNFWSSMALRGQTFGTKRDGSTMLTGNNQFISLPGYQAITAGSPQLCTNNYCGRTKTKTFIEKFALTYNLPPTKVATIASWNQISNAAAAHPDSVFINAGNAPLEDGTEDPEVAAINAEQLNDPPEWGAARRDVYTHKHAMSYLIRNQPRFLWIGLNDSDEWAHKDRYDKHLEALNNYDGWLKEVFDLVKDHPFYSKKTCIFVTTDHGRGVGKDWVSHSSSLPTSAFVWMYVSCPGIKNSSSFTNNIMMSRITSHLNIRPTIEKILGLEPKKCLFCGDALSQLFGNQWTKFNF